MIGSFSIGFLRIGWIDVVDVLLVTTLFYQLYKLLRGSVALKVFLGFMSLYLFYLVVKAAGMELLTSILGQFMSVGVLAGTIALNTLALRGGARLLRVHDVAEAVQTIQLVSNTFPPTSSPISP